MGLFMLKHQTGMMVGKPKRKLHLKDIYIYGVYTCIYNIYIDTGFVLSSPNDPDGKIQYGV
jgi:hypothetical protein